MSKDGKNKFYRQLELDKQAKEAIKFYRIIKKSLLANLDRKINIYNEAEI